MAAAGSLSIPTRDGSCVCTRVGLVGGSECAGGSGWEARDEPPSRHPSTPGSRRDRVQNVDSSLERRKEPRSPCSVPEPLQLLSFLCAQVPKPPFSFLTIPHSSPSSPAFPFASSIRLSFSCFGILSAPGRLLFPSPSVFLSHFASRPFFNLFCVCVFFPLPSIVLSPRSSFLSAGSTLFGRINVPLRLFADTQYPACAPGYWLHAGHPLRFASVRGISRAAGRVGTLLRIPCGAQS